MRKICFICLWAVLLSACRGQNGQEFMAPEILSIEADVSGATAVLRATLSDSRVERCGFTLDDGETKVMLDGELQDLVFSATATGLEVDKTYHWEAFATAGNAIIRSQEQVFTAVEGAIPIPDPVFKAYLLKDYDSNGDGEISQTEANLIWRISFCTNELGVKSLSGIEYLPYLEEIDCPGEFLEDVDHINREHYYLSTKYDNKGPIGTLESLNLSHNPELRVLRVQNNAALGDYQHVLDLSKNLKLERIDLGFTALQMPDVSHLPGLLEMRFSNIWGPLPNLKPFTQLRALDLCYEKTGKRMDVDVSHCPYLEELYVGGIARTISDLSLNPELRILMDIGNGFTERDLSILPKLVDYHGHHNRYRTLDVSANPDLNFLMVSPMDDDLLDTLYIAPGQRIPGVTENRSTEFIPERTVIVEKSVE